MIKINIPPHLNRFVTIYSKNSPKIPQELFGAKEPVQGLDEINLPLPSARDEYRVMARGNNGVCWYGATTGLTRYDPNAPFKEDIIQSFSADRNLPDSCVEALLAQGDNVWVLTERGAAYIEMKTLTAEDGREAIALLVAERKSDKTGRTVKL